MRIGIIGGGMMGLATAYYLGQAGFQVSVLEKEKEVGGLSASEEILPGVRWDLFYHVVLPTDEYLLKFIEEIGLAREVNFIETKTGFYSNGRIHSMSSTLEFLKFKPLAIWDKVRLGIGILYASHLNNSPSLENMPAETWLKKIFGKANYEKLWRPLLRSKLGSASSQVSASFIWAYIHRLYGTRKTGSKREVLGCVKGGYHSIFTQLQKKISEHNGEILLNHWVKRIEPLVDGRIRVYDSYKKATEYDYLICTVPNQTVIDFWPDVAFEYKAQLERIRYLKLICLNLVLKKSLSPYYVMNITDPGFPFTGLIEATHLMPPEVLDGKGLLYLPRYMSSDDSFYEKTDQEIIKIFLESLKRIFPGFSAEDIVRQVVHKETYVQPVQEINYSAKIPAMETPHKNIYLVNTTMIQNSSLNNNQVVRLAEKMSEILKKSINKL